MSKTFSPSVVESLTGWTTAGQRDLRSKGYLVNYGSPSAGGRHLFSGRDVVAFWLAAQIQNFMRNDGAVNLLSAFGVAWTNAPKVADLAAGKPVPAPVTAFIWTGAAPGEVQSGEAVELNSMADLDDKSFEAAKVFDWRRYAARLPQDILDAVDAA